MAAQFGDEGETSAMTFQSSDNLPPCARCGGPVLISGAVPVNDAEPVQLQLCPACDADTPAAGAFIAWFRSGAGKVTDPQQVKDNARQAALLFDAWQEEAMTARGYHQVPNDPPAPYTGPQPSGRG
jgi:uncharacterized protein CbrC (UPF0167 family)